ncbi:Protein DedA [Campylobacter majalis]|uniref:Protein DedA n=1 Tax=Campylobacter majalis TaxID=2790656 RepID=A0ABM8Q4J6_9BACT|nr:DedA family protein [Campylobacter majalis]CAD7287754.1 Protein DedA [Campylobacter majalis]
MFHTIIDTIVSHVSAWGYFGIFSMMFLESSFFPFPSEIVMMPAGYLASKGEMSLVLAFLAGSGGSLAGALFNYYLCFFFGRSLIERYGKFIGITEAKMQKFEAFFNKHGEISTFNCRLIPGIRQYISLPAGLAKMNVFKFSLFTALGASIWVAILLGVGYFLGSNPPKNIIYAISIMLVLSVLILTFIYIKKQNRSAA